MKINAMNVLVTADRRVQLTWPYPGRVVIPAGAVWDEAQGEWALGDRDADGRKHGLTAYYRADSSLANHCEYVHGVPHGWFKRYHESGEVSREGTFVDGEIHGADRSYRSDTPTTELAFPVDQTGADVWRCELSWWHGRVTGVRWYDRAGSRVTRWGAPHEPYAPVPELNLLWELQDWAGFEAYAQGFGLARFGDQSGLRAGWTEDDDALARLIPFAQATGTGSEYAFWRVDDRTDIGSLPVVVFGDEGGELVMARNVSDLLRLLGYDTEPSVWPDEAYFYRGEGWKHRSAHENFVAWLEQHDGPAPADDPNAIVAAARDEYGAPFKDWVRTVPQL